MNTVALGMSLRVVPRVTFGNEGTPPDPEKTLAEQQNTLKSAKAFTQGGFIVNADQPVVSPAAVEPVNARISQLRAERARLLSDQDGPGLKTLIIGTAVAGLCGTGIYCCYQVRNNPSWESSSFSYNDAGFFQVPLLLGGLLASFSAGIALIGKGPGVLNVSRQMKKALAEAKTIESRLLHVKEGMDSVSQLQGALLDRWMTEEASALSRQMAQTYQEEPEVQSHLDSLFGGRDNLPSAEDLVQLFTYFSYLDIKSQPGQKQISSSDTVPRLELQVKTLVYLQAARRMGELFAFVTPAEKEAFGQTFNKTYAWQAQALEGEVRNTLASVQSLLTQKVETEKHLKLAKQALLTAKLSMTIPPEKVEEIKTLIQQFKEHQSKVQKSIERLQSGKTVEVASCQVLNQEFDQLVDYLKLVLSANQLTEQSLQVNKGMETLAAQLIRENALTSSLAQ